MTVSSDQVNPAEWQRLNELFEEAVELPVGDQADFLDRSCGRNLKLRADAERLLAAARKIQQKEFLTDDAFCVGARMIARSDPGQRKDGQHIGRFRIVAKLAEGGMGAVYLAERDDFEQRVALKLIRHGIDSNEILRRFRIERDVLAALNHPNIARLLDGGTTDDGQPFLAIEYVAGERVDRYCSRLDLDVRRRLELFLKVCAAVAYAHQNLTVHRDLKPSNILVTEDGEPKLLDFGIAKLLAGAELTDETATADRLLTPEYASPEQLRGEKITTASDVYGLGVLLYELLTGRRPFELKGQSAFAMIDSVCNSEPPPPSSRHSIDDDGAERRSPVIDVSELKGDLDTIILTALRKDAQLRYSSVEHFSEDIRRYLAGMPVVARAPTLRYRAGKFVRRNRVTVAFASIAVVALVSGAAIASWQAFVARGEAERARQSFDEVRALANTFVNDWHEGIAEEAISPEVRGRLANISSDYLSKLAADTDDPEVLREAAAAQIKLGHEYAYFMIDTSKARASLRNAEQIARRLYAADANDKAARSLLVLSLMKYAEFFGAEDLEATIASRKEQIGLRTLNLADAPDDVGELRDLAILHEQTGGVLTLTGRLDDARSHFLVSDDLHARRIALLSAAPASAETLARLATSFTMRGWNLAENLGDLRSGAGYAQQAVETATSAAAVFPGDRSLNVALVSAHSELATILKRIGEHTLAIETLQSGITANRRFGANGNDGYFNRREYDSWLQIADSHYSLGSTGRAYDALTRSLEIRRQFTERNSGGDSMRTYLTHAFLVHQAGRLLGRMNRRREADELFDEAEDHLARIPATARHKIAVGQPLAALLISRGDLVAGLIPCQQPLAPIGPLSPDCSASALEKRSLARAESFYRRCLDLIASLPQDAAHTYSDNELQTVAEGRLALLKQSVVR